MMRDGQDAKCAIRRDAIDHGVGDALAQPPPSPIRHWRTGVGAAHHQRRDLANPRDEVLD